MSTLEALTSQDLSQTVSAFRDALRTHQDELNRLNVYPVPDGDTGTNMALTLEAVCSELEDAHGMAEVCHAISHGSLMGARGNSGVILSQILRGLAGTFTDLEQAGAEALVTGLRRAADAAYEAVMRPVEGTILTVARVAAEAAESWTSGGGGPLVELLDRLATAAREAVANTPELLPVLKEARVVDAGGKGFALLFDAMLVVVDGRPLPEPDLVVTPAAIQAHFAEDDVSSLRYEVMYMLESPDEKISPLKDAWAAIGDSIVVVGGDGLWNCHVHTNDIGSAVEAGIEAGRPRDIRITDLLEQVEEEEWVKETAQAEVSPSADQAHVPTGVVAVAVGEGVRRLLASLGVRCIVAGGQSMNPSTAQILDAVEETPADAIVVLPDNKNIVPVARQVAELTDRPVEVVPTQSVIEGLCSLVAYDPHTPLAENVAAMSEAIARIRTGEVTQAVRDATTPFGAVAAGDWIALDGEGICAKAATAGDAATALVDHLMWDDAELVTVLCGDGASADESKHIEEHIGLEHPQVEAEFHEGGQPLYLYLIGVE